MRNLQENENSFLNTKTDKQHKDVNRQKMYELTESCSHIWFVYLLFSSKKLCDEIFIQFLIQNCVKRVILR